MADWLRDRYPAEMTVVIQHWFENLEVTDEGFSVTLNFGNNPEHLSIPFDAVRTFVDPSVEFGLRFETHDEADEDDEEEDAADEATTTAPRTIRPRRRTPGGPAWTGSASPDPGLAARDGMRLHAD